MTRPTYPERWTVEIDQAIRDADTGEMINTHTEIAGSFPNPIAARRRALYRIRAWKTDLGYARIVREELRPDPDAPWITHWIPVDDAPEIVDG